MNLKDLLNEMTQAVEQSEQDIDSEIETIVDNAYIMPFQTRELAQEYLESRQSDFKVGLFFAKNKTEQEKQQRLERLINDLSERVKSQIEWHLRELALKTLKENGFNQPELIDKAQSINISIQPESIGEKC